MIKLLGVGTGGTDTVGRLVESVPAGVECWSITTDSMELARARGLHTVQIGRQLTRGLGSGGNPTIGERAAEESRQELLAAIGGADVVFLVATLGGGTGTGAGPVIARMAAEAGVLVAAVVTRPFTFEGRRRDMQAEAGVAAMRTAADLLVIVPNDRLLETVGSRTSMQEAFRLVDRVIAQLLGQLGAEPRLQEPEQLVADALAAAGLDGCEVVAGPRFRDRRRGAGSPSGLEPMIATPEPRTGFEPSL